MVEPIDPPTAEEIVVKYPVPVQINRHHLAAQFQVESSKHQFKHQRQSQRQHPNQFLFDT